ncbi:hypothetical protein GF354_01900 [Candidatus Peregrinibacteria bacterium]|nr:hypothetical protein [Candidatus Peregrinibacteria bacterium]
MKKLFLLLTIFATLTACTNSPETETANTNVTLYSDSEYNFSFTADTGCDQYLKVTKTAQGAETQYNVSLPSAKEWKGNLMQFFLVSQDEYEKILNDDMPGAPRIVLDLSDNILYTRGLIQSWPEESDLPENCREVTAEKN